MDLIAKTFRLDPKVADELERTSKREERTMTAIVERALRDYFSRAKTARAEDRAQSDQVEPAAA